MTSAAATEPRWNADGLIAAIAQHADTGEVLMLAWMNAESLRLTLETGEAHYWSRSRNELWRKGATSGQLQAVDAVLLDCDGDAVLLKVRPGGDGGACHLGQRSCFHRPLMSRALGDLAPPAVTPADEHGATDPDREHRQDREERQDLIVSHEDHPRFDDPPSAT